MGKFKIGDKVIATRNHYCEFFKKGDEFVIDGFTCCPKCGVQCVYLTSMQEICESPCKCGHSEWYVRESYSEDFFEKPISLSACIEYRLKVSIPELVELKELQNQ